jgi:hypothetical protein
MNSTAIYPSSPGFKEQGGTSQQAALFVGRHRAERLRAAILVELRKQPMTADETAKALGEPIWSCRPRFSELCRMKQIEKTGKRRCNESGAQANVWRATTLL